ncbi:MAG: outer membrane protein assembly factor BamC [Pseudomonadota bacterium]
MSDDRGFIVKRSDDYLEAEESKRLEVPEGLSGVNVARDPYAIPPIANTKGALYPERAPRPAPLFGSGENDNVKIQKLGDRRWLVLPEPPPIVWPKVKQFLSENGIETAQEVPLAGRITTSWFDAGGTDYRDVVRLAVQQAKRDAQASGGLERLSLTVEQGMRDNSTEVHLRHQNDALAERTAIRDLIGFRSVIPEVEEAILREVGGYLASEVSTQAVSMVGQDIIGASKAQIDLDAEGQPVLLLDLDFDRAWATITQSMSNAEIEVTDRDRSEGLLYIELPERALTGEDNSGLFRRMFGRGGNVLPLTVPLRAAADGGGYEVRVFDESGERIEPEFARNVLNLLRDFAN